MAVRAHAEAAALRVLRRLWPYVGVIAVGVLAWGIVWAAHLSALPETSDDATIGLTGTLVLVDVTLGITAVGILPLRTRHPLAVAIVTSAALIASAAAAGAAALAVLRLAFVGGRRDLTVAGTVWTLAILGNGALLSSATGAHADAADVVGIAAAAVALYIGLAGIGTYRRARAETLHLLRERADHVEREREREIREAQESERLRIAREMHDVLAHRISLVALHAGALTFRDDLPRERIAETAHVIHDSAALALAELRELLGVLRTADQSTPRSPQPLLAHLPALLADTRAAGVSLEVEFTGIDAIGDQPVTTGVAEATSRAAYRIVQEALTNARRHAPGTTVQLRLARSAEELVITARNRLATREPTPEHAGMGLVGLAERAQLAGGTLVTFRTRDEFVLVGRLPWR